jgi:hypothetical protein
LQSVDPSLTSRVFLALLSRLWEEHRMLDEDVPPWGDVVEPAQRALALAGMLCVEDMTARDSLSLDVRAELPILWARHYDRPPRGGIPTWESLQEAAQEALVLAGRLVVSAVHGRPKMVAVWDPIERGEA